MTTALESGYVGAPGPPPDAKCNRAAQSEGAVVRKSGNKSAAGTEPKSLLNGTPLGVSGRLLASPLAVGRSVLVTAPVGEATKPCSLPLLSNQPPVIWPLSLIPDGMVQVAPGGAIEVSVPSL
jgi:hypothetical protein